jgi:DNA-binding protein HU-beta
MGNTKKNMGGLCLNKLELVKSLAEKAGLTQKDAAKALESLLGIIQEVLTKGDKVGIIGFGSFEVRDRKERKVISPATGQEIIVPANKVPAFKPGKYLKESVVPPKVVAPVIVPQEPVKDAKKNKKNNKKK